MVKVTYDIQIGKTSLKTIEALEVISDVNNLSDTCTIDLPAYVHNVPFDAEQVFTRGAVVTVKAGYNNQNKTIFEGFLKAISANSPTRLTCEDGMYKFRTAIPNKSFKNVSINTILNYIISNLSGFTLKSTVPGITFSQFNIINATAYEVLQKLKQETSISIYIEGTTLNAHLAYTGESGRIRGNCTFNMQKNIQEGSSFTFLNGKDRNFLVKIEGLTKKNTKVEVQEGTEGGEVITLKRHNIEDKATLQKIAKEVFAIRNLDGYMDSTLHTWGNANINVADACTIIDEDYPSRTSSYFIMSVTRKINTTDGYMNEAKLGVRLS